jgi:hypothetical protein
MIEFISVKLQRPVVDLSQGEIADLLLAHGVQPKLIARVLSILTYGEIERYALVGSAASSQDLLIETAQVIDELDRLL